MSPEQEAGVSPKQEVGVETSQSNKNLTKHLTLKILQEDEATNPSWLLPPSSFPYFPVLGAVPSHENPAGG